MNSLLMASSIKGCSVVIVLLRISFAEKLLNRRGFDIGIAIVLNAIEFSLTGHHRIHILVEDVLFARVD